MNLFLTLLAGVAGCIAAGAWAAGGADLYKTKCSTCHDAGLAGAPRIGDQAEWAKRNRQGTDALYQSALRGKPNTAMLAKGGFAELSDQEVIAIVDYLLASGGQKPRTAGANTPAPAPATTARTAKIEKVDDETLTGRVKAALAKTRGIVANDIKLEAVDGVITLRGVVDNAAQIKRAEDIALKTPGVRQVDNKLIPKDLFVWD